MTVSCPTLSRWRRLYEAGGFDALVPSPRQCSPRTPAEVLAIAEALKREKPGRTAAQVRRILALTAGWAPSDRTLQRLFGRLELNAPVPGQEEQRAFGRFECTRPNEMWTGDTLHGPVISGSKSYLFAFLDDHSRAVMGARWAYHDDVVRMAAAFRPALQRRGVPQAIYLDNGSAFVDAWLLRGCAVLGIRLIHSRPGKPKAGARSSGSSGPCGISSWSRSATGPRIADLAEMNRLFQAWLETVYHRAVHSETGEAPPPGGRRRPRPSGPSPSRAGCARRSCGPSGARRPRPPWSRLHGNSYQVDAWLAGRTVELVFDPFDLDRVEVRLAGKPAGTAVPFTVGRHRHPKTRTGGGQARAEPAPTGIDYLAALGDGHDAALRDQVCYRFLIDGEPTPPKEPRS